MNLRISVLAAAVAACVVGTSVASAATVIVSDSFLNLTTHPAWASLNGSAPEVTSAGVGNWVSDGSAWITDATSGVRGWQTSPSAEISIPAPAAAITVQADLFPANYNTGWIAIGFQDSAATGNWWGSHNKLWVLASSKDSTIEVYQDGLAYHDVLGSQSFTATETIALTYDPIAKTYEVFANGTPVMGPTAVSFTGTIASAGFFGNGPGTAVNGGNPALKNFVVSAVPEPMSLGLFGLSGLALMRRRRA